MKVILLRDVARIGRRFEVKDVPSGHALNYLIPRKLAEVATPENMSRLNALKTKQADKHAQEEVSFKEALVKFADTPVTLKVDTNEQGHLFKGLHKEDIAHALAEQGATVEPNQIDLRDPIKAVGSYEVELHSGETRGTIKVVVEAM